MQFKKNISLMIGIAIPIVMIVLVAASIYLPGMFAPSPKFNFLYVVGDGYFDSQQYLVRGRKLEKRVVRKQDPDEEEDVRFDAKLYIHDVMRNESREVSFEEAQRLSVDTNKISPDGFEVVHGTSEGGIFPLLFFHSTDYEAVYLKGRHTSKKLNLQEPGDRYYDGRFRFLGWIE